MENVGVQPNRDWFLDRPVEAADNSFAPIGRRRNIRSVDLALPHPLESPDLASFTARCFPHIPAAPPHPIIIYRVWTPGVCHLSSPPTTSLNSDLVGIIEHRSGDDATATRKPEPNRPRR